MHGIFSHSEHGLERFPTLSNQAIDTKEVNRSKISSLIVTHGENSTH